MKRFLQLRPIFAIAKADILSISKNPSTIVFNLGFPIIFILVLGFISNSNNYFKIIVDGDSTNAPIYKAITKNPLFIIESNSASNEKLLQQGRIIAKINIQKQGDNTTIINLITATSAIDKFPIFEAYLKNYIQELQNKSTANIVFHTTTFIGRKFKRIDFLLPGMLGFSLLSSGLFGVAYSFFGMKQNMIFKRIFCTPISTNSVLIGFLLSRISFQFFNSIVIILLGFLVFDFTLINGWFTFINMMFLSFAGMLCFMSWGFFISGIAKNDAIIPALTNILSLPQWLLGGVFFSNEGFPIWLKNIANVLPLTRLNDGLRKIAFDGLNFYYILPDIFIILAWTLLGILLAKRFFKWQ